MYIRNVAGVFEKISAQIEACMGEFRRSVSRDVVRELFVLGGAGATGRTSCATRARCRPTTHGDPSP